LAAGPRGELAFGRRGACGTTGTGRLLEVGQGQAADAVAGGWLWVAIANHGPVEVDRLVDDAR
jgi:hypothetical protein